MAIPYIGVCFALVVGQYWAVEKERASIVVIPSETVVVHVHLVGWVVVAAVVLWS